MWPVPLHFAHCPPFFSPLPWQIGHSINMLISFSCVDEIGTAVLLDDKALAGIYAVGV